MTATGLEGPDIYRNFILTSDDDGATWSAPQDVTATTKRPERATTIASGPGIGIQLTRGPHKGRLIIPFNEGPYGVWQNYAVFSDDAGKTWRFGDDVPEALIPDGKAAISRINEVQVAELSDGSVRLDSRQFAGATVRKTAISRDGGTTWSPAAELPEVTDPSCMAGLLRYSFDDAAGRGRLLHTGPDSTKRERGTVWLSLDDGATWPVKRVLWPGAFAYSVPTRLDDGTVGVLFEADDYRRIVFARFPIASIEKGYSQEKLPGVVPVAIETSAGAIEVEVDLTHAPVTGGNFLKYVDQKMYDGGRFHRAVRLDNQIRKDVKIEVVQAGRDPERAKTEQGFGPIPLERTSVTGLRHVDGVLSMARTGPDTATSDFFICVGDQPSLDFGGPRNSDGQGFAAFGRVTAGMDVVRKIHAGATDDREHLLPPVVIRRVHRR